jgi:predicted choloylglycine hydrolase
MDIWIVKRVLRGGNMNRLSRRFILSAYVALALFITTALPAAARVRGYTETVIAGGPDQVVEVRHVVLKGSNFEIGQKIGELAKRDGVRITPSKETILNRAKREYMARNYPILYTRMKGVAAAYGLNIADDSYDVSGLFDPQMAGPGCSVAFYPASATGNGHGILSRNYEFTTGDIHGRRPQKGGLPIMGRPYLFEIHPDKGYSSLSICAFEYLGGVLDGINSEGLVVAILVERDSMERAGHEPSREVGMHELMSMRYLLDNCKNVEEAKEALLSLKHYYCFLACHYIVGDKTGRSFIYEFSPNRNRSYIIDGQGPQWITNHLVFHHDETKEKNKDKPSSSLRRYNKLEESIRAKERFSLEDIAAINAEVAVPPVASGNAEMAPIRTLWYAQYDTELRTLTVKFYLGEKPDPGNEKRVILEYSPLRTYVLKK